MEEINAWIARDKNNELWIFTLHPYKSLGNQWECSRANRCMRLDSNLFPEVKWSDAEPTKVKLEIVR